jgi:hypothetical protein
MSPNSVTADQTDKPADYAAAGIDSGTMAVTDPVELTVVLADLH